MREAEFGIWSQWSASYNQEDGSVHKSVKQAGRYLAKCYISGFKVNRQWVIVLQSKTDAYVTCHASILIGT